MRLIQLSFAISLVIALACGSSRPVPQPPELEQCKADADCIIVEYSHCCGATKLAINKAFEERYKKTPDWQTFHDPGACSTLGECMDDNEVKSAECFHGTCKKRWPQDPVPSGP